MPICTHPKSFSPSPLQPRYRLTTKASITRNSFSSTPSPSQRVFWARAPTHGSKATPTAGPSKCVLLQPPIAKQDKDTHKATPSTQHRPKHHPHIKPGGPFDALDAPGVPEARSMDPRGDADANEPMAPTEQGSTTFAPPSSSAGQAPALPPPLDPPVPPTLGGNKRPSSTGLALTEDLYLHDLGTNVAVLTTKKVSLSLQATGEPK